MPVKPELRDILKEFYCTEAADKWEDIGIMLNIKICELNEIKSAEIISCVHRVCMTSVSPVFSACCVFGVFTGIIDLV